MDFETTEETYHIPRYFKALANMKYRAFENRKLADKTGDPHFNHSAYYEVIVHSIQEIKEKEYQDLKNGFSLRNIEGPVSFQKNGNNYQLDLKEFYTSNVIQIEHNQIEDGVLHAFLRDTEVVFKLEVEASRFVQNPIPVKATKVEPQIEVEKETNTYQPTSPSPSNDKIKIRPPREPFRFQMPSFDGCLSGIVAFLLILYPFIPISLAAKSGSFFPILFGLGIPIVLFLSMGIRWNFGRFIFPIIGWIFRWSLALFIFGLVATSVLGLFNFTRNEGVRQTEDDDARIEEIDPVQGDSTDSELIHIKLTWRSLDNKKFKGDYYLNKSKTQQSSNFLKSLENQNYADFGQIYRAVSNHDNADLGAVFAMLDSIRKKEKLNRMEFLNATVSMVQSIDYVLILDNGCNNQENLRNSTIYEILQSGVECEGYQPYGLKTPLKFCEDLKGDCDSRTLLLYTLLKHFNYDVAIINSNYYGHSMLGVHMPSASGSYKLYNGKPYYFWETTTKGNKIGFMPPSTFNLNYWNITLL